MASASKTLMGFEELEHTADWSLRVWAPNLPTFFEQAATGMLHLMGAESLDTPIELSDFTVEGDDPESLLVAFLTELLFLLEKSKVPRSFYFMFEDTKLKAQLECVPLKSLAKEIKAVTFHNLSIQKQNGVLTAIITFDV